MSSFVPWVAVAGMGALHGLNPATGWMFAAAWGVRSHRRGLALRALLPIAVGHAASVALVAAVVALGLVLDKAALQLAAGVLLAALAGYQLWRRKAGRSETPGAHVRLALWSFMMSTAHGAGLMLVPALIPLCIGDGPARAITASGSLVLALAAVGVHMAAMLAVTGLTAAMVCAGYDGGVRRLQALRGRLFTRC